MSMEKFSARQLKKAAPRAKRNENVEGPVVLEIKNGLNILGWDLQVIESKAVYSESAGRYIGGQTKAGTSDLVGNTPDGIAAFIEVKAKGKRSTLRPDQHMFLSEKIMRNCFAICADSLDSAKSQYEGWLAADNKKKYLGESLPKLAPRFNDDLTFD